MCYFWFFKYWLPPFYFFYFFAFRQCASFVGLPMDFFMEWRLSMDYQFSLYPPEIQKCYFLFNHKQIRSKVPILLGPDQSVPLVTVTYLSCFLTEKTPLLITKSKLIVRHFVKPDVVMYSLWHFYKNMFRPIIKKSMPGLMVLRLMPLACPNQLCNKDWDADSLSIWDLTNNLEIKSVASSLMSSKESSSKS